MASRQQIEHEIVGHKISTGTADFNYGADGSYVSAIAAGRLGVVYGTGAYTIQDGKICKTAGFLPCVAMYDKDGLIVIDYGPQGRVIPMRDDAPCQAALRNAAHDRLATQQQIMSGLIGHTVILSSGETDEFQKNGSFRSSLGKLGTYSIQDGQMLLKFSFGGICRAVAFNGTDYTFITPYGDRWTVVSR